MTVTADTFLNPVREFSQLGVKEIGYELGEGDEITYLPVRGYVEREIPLLANFIELMGRKAVTQTLASQVYYSQREARFNRWEEGSRLDPFRFLAMRMADVIIARGLLEGRRPNYSLAQILGAQHLFGMRYEPIRPNYHGEFDNYTYYPPRIRSNNFTVHGVANYCHKAVQTANPDRSRVLLTGVNLLYEPYSPYETFYQLTRKKEVGIPDGVLSVPAGGHAKSRHVLKSRSDLPDGSHLLTDITGLRETVEETDLPLPYSHARPLGLARQTLPSRRSSDGNGLVNYLCYVWSTVGMIKKDSEDRVPVTFGPGKGENDMSATEIMRLMTLSSIAMLAMMMSQDRARY